jgi:hypothetical protein
MPATDRLKVLLRTFSGIENLSLKSFYETLTNSVLFYRKPIVQLRKVVLENNIGFR